MRLHEVECDAELDRAEILCRQRNARLTQQRREVLEILYRQAKPMGAYELLQLLQQQQPSAKPPTVYRALDFLQEHGLVHRIESLNAFIGCVHPDAPHASQFLICRDCGEVEELEDRRVDHTLQCALQACGFEAEGRVVEVLGKCARCAHLRDNK